MGCDHRDEADQASGGAPQQIADAIPDDHLALPVDGAFGLLEGLGVLQQGVDLDLLAIDPGPAWPARATLPVGCVGHGIGLHAGDQMAVLGEEAGDDLVCGIVCVCDEVEGLTDGGDAEESEHLVEQGAAVTIGPDDAFVDARGERNGEDGGGGLDQQTDRLQRMSRDVLGLGV